MDIRKIVKIILSGAILMCMFVGCVSNAETRSNTSDKTTKGTTPLPSDSSSKSTKNETLALKGKGGKVLVVYYSATGSTEKVANTIVKTLNADSFELIPTEIYTEADLNWSNKESRVSKEHDNPQSRNVELTAKTVDDWESYDTVFIGYPIWWGIAAWPTDTFIRANNFTGKTVIPFCTSLSSGLGESDKLLAQMAGTGNWLEGERFRSGVSGSDISAWAKSVMQ